MTFTIKSKRLSIAFTFCLFLQGFSHTVAALELDWTGQFRSDMQWIANYPMASALTPDAARQGAGGYYVAPGGASGAHIQGLFLKLNPRVIVNDNIYLKSEWHVGDPIYGVMGSGVPYDSGQRFFNQSYNRGALITAQRYYAEVLTDIGTVQVGRAPLHWGLGVMWNSGDGPWDRYQSTGDTIRMASKFGSFTLIPAFTRISSGSTVGGNFNSSTGTTDKVGWGGINDYSLNVKYHNIDDEFEIGFGFTRRIGGAAQDPGSATAAGSGTTGLFGTTTSGFNYNVWDIYARKHLWKFDLGLEVPIMAGSLSDGTSAIKYSSFAVATEADLAVSEDWNVSLRSGYVPGQASFDGTVPSTFKSMSFHPNYQLGLIMFHYQFANFGGRNVGNSPSTSQNANLVSPYDNPITNALYISPRLTFKLSKWDFYLNMIYAKALQTAQAGKTFYNSWSKRFVANTSGLDQESSLGVEFDLGANYKWDDYLIVGWDNGLYLPGSYYAFSNTATENGTQAVFATQLRLGITF